MIYVSHPSGITLCDDELSVRECLLIKKAIALSLAEIVEDLKIKHPHTTLTARKYLTTERLRIETANDE